MSQIIQSNKLINGVNLNTPRLPDPPKYSPIGEPPEFLAVVCVWWGDLYGIDYVEKLYNSVKRNLSIPHHFYCITEHENVPYGVQRIEAPNNSKGWWQKVNLFRKDLFPEELDSLNQCQYGRVIYLDLDVVITGSIDEIASSSGEFVMIENFGPNKKHAAHNSSIVLWNPSTLSQNISDAFDVEVTRELHGDQCWIWRVMDSHITNFRKDLVDSYKYSKRSDWKRSRGEVSPVMIFHGNPKPHQCNDTWVKKNWR
jgi:hypothetical protein